MAPRRSRPCAYCAEKSAGLDYKDPRTLSRFITEGGKIKPRRQTGMCYKHQRQVSAEIKRSRHLAFLAAATVE